MKIIRLLWPLCLLLCLHCTGGKDRTAWKDEGILRIGTDATYPPFEMANTATGRLEGFDIDVITAVCERNGWKTEFIETPFDGIISGLKGDKYDCIISAMTITPQREAIVEFSQPYYLAGQVVAVPESDSLIRSVEDLKGKKVGVQLGTTGEKMAKSLSGLSVFSFDNIGAAFIDMENGQIDAVLNDWPTTREYIRLKGMAKTVGEILSRENYGIAVARGQDELLSLINAAIDSMRAEGIFTELELKWFGNPSPVE